MENIEWNLFKTSACVELGIHGKGRNFIMKMQKR